MKFTVCLLALSFCAVISAVDESTESDLVITTLPAIPENDVSRNDDDVPVNHVNFLRQSDIVDSESTTVHFSELACTRDNMEWLACGPRCYQTCGFQPRDGREVALERKSRAYCASSNDTGCYAGCYCKSGYVRFHDNCVLPIQCPSKRLITVKCDMPC